MNYHNIHDVIIERAKNRTIRDYTEKHHIIPRSLGGSNSPDNVVRLTPQEHRLVHLLLVKMYPDDKRFVFAARRMFAVSNTHSGRSKNTMYGWLRKKHSVAMRKLHIGMRQSKETIEKRISKIRGQKRTPEQLEKMSIAQRGKKKSPEHIEKIRLARLGTKQSIETITKRKNSMLGKSCANPRCSCIFCHKNVTPQALKRFHIECRT
jgi:hypothetical protein